MSIFKGKVRTEKQLKSILFVSNGIGLITGLIMLAWPFIFGYIHINSLSSSSPIGTVSFFLFYTGLILPMVIFAFSNETLILVDEYRMVSIIERMEGFDDIKNAFCRYMKVRHSLTKWELDAFDAAIEKAEKERAESVLSEKIQRMCHNQVAL